MTTGTSGVTWSMVLMAVYNGLQSIVGSLSPLWTIIINAVILVIGLYVHNGQIKAGSVR